MSDPNPYSDLPGTATQTPAQDELEARRTFPPSQQPFPRIPSIPAPKAQPKTSGGGGGGFSMDTLMPLLLMAAPFLEAHQPGYGMGLVHGVLQHQQEQEQTNRNMILTFAKEFAGTSDEEWPAVAAVLKSQGLNPEQIGTVKNIRGVFRPADYAQQQYLRQIQSFLIPEMAQSAVTGKPFDPTQMPAERFQALQTAIPGSLPGYGVRDVMTGVRPAVPGQPGAFRGTPSEIGTAAQPIPGTPAQPITQPQVFRRGETPPATYGMFFEKTRGTMFENMLMPTDARGAINMKEATANMESVHLYEDAEKHKAKLQEYLRGKLEDALRNPGSHDLATLKSQIEAPGADMNFSVELMQARDKAAKAEAALPKPEMIVLRNMQTGETQTLQLPPGAKLHTFTPPNAPTRHLLLYPDGHREWLPPGVVPTNVPTPTEKLSPADKEVLNIFFTPNSYAQLQTRPKPEQEAFQKRLQQAFKNIGIDAPMQPPPPPTSPIWAPIIDAIKSRFGEGLKNWLTVNPAGATPPAGTPPPTTPTRPQPAGTAPAKWTPPPGAIRGTDKTTGRVLYKVGNMFYDENGNVVK